MKKTAASTMTYEQIIAELKSMESPENREGMKRFGITTDNALGIAVPKLRALAKRVGKDHELAQKLYDCGIHEARLLAGMIDSPQLVTKKQMDDWTAAFDSWDVCDMTCMNLFCKTPFALEKVRKWAKDDREYVRRAAFALTACLAVHYKEPGTAAFEELFPLMEKYSADERNMVKKAVNWALRQVGKRNETLRVMAVEWGEKIAAKDDKSSRWIAADALRELRDPKVVERVKIKGKK